MPKLHEALSQLLTQNRELSGIAQKIRHHLPQAALISPDRWQGGR